MLRKIFLIQETKLIQFAVLFFSSFVFLILRHSVQEVIDRIFHRETYDSAKVVKEFETQLAGIYKFDVLAKGIMDSGDGLEAQATETADDRAKKRREAIKKRKQKTMGK